MLNLDNFVGNNDLRQQLKVAILAARETNSPLHHVLLKGPAGTGKTTLASVVAKEFGTELRVLTPGTAKKVEDLRKLFLDMPSKGYNPETGQVVGPIQQQVVFCDEVHQLSLVAQENLGIAMQDWRLPINLDGLDVFEWVPRFTLIGATTLPGKLSKPFQDRFRFQAEFEPYSLEEAVKICILHADQLSIRIEPGAAEAIAKRSRGVARLVVRFLERLHDYAVVLAKNNTSFQNVITRDLAEAVFQRFLKVDEKGLTKTDIKVLKHLSQFRDPIGVDSLAVVANEDKATMERTVEPYLIQTGLLVRTKRGRLITEAGRRHLEASGHLERSAPHAGAGRVIGASSNEGR